MKRTAFVALALAFSACHASAQDRRELRIDTEVVLKSAKAVLNLDHLAYAGKEPLGSFMRAS